MEESVLWAIAIGTGALGLLLLAMAGAVAVYWNTVARRPKGMTYADKPQSSPGDLAATRKERSPASSSKPQPIITAHSPWLWVKAWLFALFHAGTVSLVMGGITFFRDLAKASAEITSTGTVTFPKQLLPGTLSVPASRDRLSRPSGSSKAESDVEVGEPDRTEAASSDGAGWEVVDLVNEVGVGSR